MIRSLAEKMAADVWGRLSTANSGAHTEMLLLEDALQEAFRNGEKMERERLRVRYNRIKEIATIARSLLDVEHIRSVSSKMIAVSERLDKLASEVERINNYE